MPYRQTLLKLLFDDSYLYIGAWCGEPHPEKPKAVGQPGQDVWSDFWTVNASRDFEISPQFALDGKAILPPPKEYRREGWEELHLAYVRERTDRAFQLRIQFATHQTEGVFLIRLVDPEGKECFRLLDEKHNPSRTVALPADGQSGVYRVECYSQGGNWNNGMRVTGDLPAVYAYSPATHLCGWGPLYLLARSDATEVSVDILLFAGQAKLWAPDGTLLATTVSESNRQDPLSRSNPPLTARIKPAWRGKEFRLDFGPAGFPYTYLRGLKGFEPFLAQAQGQAFVPLLE